MESCKAEANANAADKRRRQQWHIDKFDGNRLKLFTQPARGDLQNLRMGIILRYGMGFGHPKGMITAFNDFQVPGCCQAI